MLSSVLSGVISSIIAIALVEAYLAAKSWSTRRKLKRLLALEGLATLIVAPLKHQDLSAHAISYRDAYAFSHIFELCHRVGVDATLVPFHRMSDIATERNYISVGGPLSNRFTQEYLTRYVRRFRLITQEQAVTSSEPPPRDGSRYVTGLAFGAVELLATESEEHGILIKLTPTELDQERTVHLVFGYSGHGTGAAAYYLSKYYAQLWSAFGDRAYCIAIKCYRKEGYRNMARTFVDLTEAAGILGAS